MRHGRRALWRRIVRWPMRVARGLIVPPVNALLAAAGAVTSAVAGIGMAGPALLEALREARAAKSLGSRTSRRWRGRLGTLPLAAAASLVENVSSLWHLIKAPWRAGFGGYLHAVPAFAVGVAAVGFCARAAFLTEAELAQRYIEAARQARVEQRSTIERLCLERLLQLGDERAEYRYALAMLAQREGDHRRAGGIMAGLAVHTTTGYAPAHIWQARRLLSDSPLPLEQVNEARVHLMRALETRPDDEEAHLLLAQILLNIGQVSQAEPHLARAVAVRPELRLLLAQIMARRGQRNLAIVEAESARDYLATTLMKAPHDVRLRVQYAASAAFLGDYRGAVATLEEGRQVSPHVELDRAVADYYVAWAITVLGQPPRDVDPWTLLEKAFERDHWNLAGLRLLLALRAGPTPLAARAGQQFDRLIGEAEPPIEAMLLVGGDLWDHGSQQQAREWLERAYLRDPESVEVSNNLAWMVAHSEPIDLMRALSLVNSALRAAPQHVNCLDTRAHVLMKLGRWEEARSDLRTVLSVRPEAVELHRLLADCATQLGRTAEAEFHLAVERELTARGPQTGQEHPSSRPDSR